jgi:hypothetical protein
MNLKLKSEAKKAIRQFNAIVKNQHKTSIKFVQIHGGGEFQSISLQELFKDLGIKVFLSAPHLHQQNGCAEHFIRTIIDKAQAIRFDACIPKSWWEFTVAYAVHLYNRTPVWQIDFKTPHEMLKLQRPDVSYFKVFRCGAYVFLPEEVKQNKLAPKSELMTFIGYADSVKGYLFMRSTNYVFTAVKALFNENIYPRCPHMQHPDLVDIRPPTDDSDCYEFSSDFVSYFTFTFHFFLF